MFQPAHIANNDSLQEKSLMTATPTVQDDTTVSGPKNKKKKSSDTYDALIVKASNAMTELSQIVKNKPSVKELDSFDSFGQFIVTELRGIRDASNDCIVRQAKRKIQNVLMETWDLIDQPTMPPSPASFQSSSRNEWLETPQSGPLSHSSATSRGYQPYNDNVTDLVNNALVLANITSSDYNDNVHT